MEKIKFNTIDRLLFFFCNLFLISLINSKMKFGVFFLWLLIIYSVIECEKKRKISFFVSPLIFLFPSLLIQGFNLENGKLGINLDYEILMRVLLTVTASGIFILSSRFAEFLSILKFFKVPNLLIELIVYMYKFINIMYEEYIAYRISIKNRCGKLKIEELGKISVLILKKIYLNLKNIEIALYIRGYCGKYSFRNTNITIRKEIVFLLVVYLIMGVKILKY